jgi:hypothetical protein
MLSGVVGGAREVAREPRIPIAVASTDSLFTRSLQHRTAMIRGAANDEPSGHCR